MSKNRAETIALIGVGRMGRGIGRNLLRSGFALSVFDIHSSSTQVLTELGARAGSSIDNTVRGASTVITCLPDTQSVEQAYLGEQGLLQNADNAALLIEMGTIGPETARDIGAKALQRGLEFVDAPMLRGAPEAWEGTIHILLGGSEAGRARAKTVLAHVSERIIDAGPLGSAQALKAINNAVTMANCAVLSEALFAAKAAGFSDAIFVEVLQSGLAGSRILDVYAPRFLSGKHPATGLVRIAKKDLDLFLHTAHSDGLATPVLEAALASFTRLCDSGLGEAPLSTVADLLLRHRH
jgi:3-hydroxyisobutyrate dehydrogenase-like beta-hydroxyacid dehydrogenase